MKTVEEFLFENIKALHERFSKNNFAFLYEEELRANLYCQLLKESQNLPDYQRDYSGNVLLQSRGFGPINSSIIRAEYPQVYENIGRFDIAVTGQGSDIYKLPIRAAVELKLGSDKIGSDKCAGFKADFFKLQRYCELNNPGEFTGIAIYFYQTRFEETVDYTAWYKELGNIKLTCWNDFTSFEPNHIYAMMLFPGKEEIYLSKKRIEG